MKEKDINQLFDEEVIKKFHLDKYTCFKELQKEKNSSQSFKNILFIETYKADDGKGFKIYKEEFDKLTYVLNNSGDKEDELKTLIDSNGMDVFYSVFSTKISPYLGKPSEDKISSLSNIINNIILGKEKLLNIYELFLDISKYTKEKINLCEAEILQFALRFCFDADEISDNFDNIYYPLYSNDKDINFYIPGNDIKNKKIYKVYSKIKEYLDKNPSSHGVYICTCNINKEEEDTFLEFEEGNDGYPTIDKKCKYCDEPVGKDCEKKSFYERDYYYRIFKNDKELSEMTKDKENGNCITLEKFYDDFVSEKLKEDSKGVNISSKSHFDKMDKPIRKQSQLCFRLMNLILYSHLFTNVLFTNKDEIFADNYLSYLKYIINNWNKLKYILDQKGIDIYIFMNLIYKDLTNYLSKQKKIEDYEKLLEVEQEIENIIENKIFKKTEKTKTKTGETKELSKYQLYLLFYDKNKNLFREKDSNNKTTIIKEINSVSTYKEEKDYPYYKNFLYSEYLDEKFFRNKLNEKDKEKYPVINLFLNLGKDKKKLGNEFLCFNIAIKNLINQYSGKITNDDAKILTIEKSNIYKSNQKIYEVFIKIINKKAKITLNKESSLDNFLIDGSTEKGKILINIYKEYAEIQNNLLRELLEKINAVNYDVLECQEINIQDAQKGDLLTLEFDNKSDSNEIFLMNIFREIFGNNSRVIYNNYNLFSLNFEKIEKIFENILVRNACFLKTDEIIEIKYSGEEFLDDGIFEFDNNIQLQDLNEKDKMVFLTYYEKKLKDNLDSCLEINEGLKGIIAYVNKNKTRINYNKSLFDVISEGGFPYKIDDDFKEFLKNNKNLTVSKLSNLIIYLEKLYFELAIKDKEEYKGNLDANTKNDIERYYKEKSGQLITKDKLSLAIIKLLINIILNQKSGKIGSIETTENLFDYLNKKFLWNKTIYEDSRFVKECSEYKNLIIRFKNVFDFYSDISNDFKENFEKEKKDILDKIRSEEEKKLKIEKENKREQERKKIEEVQTEEASAQQEDEGGDVDADDLDDLDAFG